MYAWKTIRRSAILSRAAFLVRRTSVCARASLEPSYATPVVPSSPRAPRPDLYFLDLHISAHAAPLLCTTFTSRGYVRMRRRIPPVQRPPEEVKEDTESESEAEDLDLSAEEADEIEDGDESEEWEGMMIDFGAAGRNKDNEEEER